MNLKYIPMLISRENYLVYILFILKVINIFKQSFCNCWSIDIFLSGCWILLLDKLYLCKMFRYGLIKKWWRHQMETFPCYWPQRPVMQRFGVFYDLCLNKRLSKRSWDGDLRLYRAHYDATVMPNQLYPPIQRSVMVSPCPSVCPPVDRVVPALYLPQYQPDTFQINTSYPTTSAVWPVQLYVKYWNADLLEISSNW